MTRIEWLLQQVDQRGVVYIPASETRWLLSLVQRADDLMICTCGQGGHCFVCRWRADYNSEDTP